MSQMCDGHDGQALHVVFGCWRRVAREIAKEHLFDLHFQGVHHNNTHVMDTPILKWTQGNDALPLGTVFHEWKDDVVRQTFMLAAAEALAAKQRRSNVFRSADNKKLMWQYRVNDKATLKWTQGDDVMLLGIMFHVWKDDATRQTLISPEASRGAETSGDAKVFEVEIDHSENQTYGIDFWTLDSGLQIARIWPDGLVDKWDKANEESANVGDIIVESNGVRGGAVIDQGLCELRTLKLLVQKRTNGGSLEMPTRELHGLQPPSPPNSHKASRGRMTAEARSDALSVFEVELDHSEGQTYGIDFPELPDFPCASAGTQQGAVAEALGQLRDPCNTEGTV